MGAYEARVSMSFLSTVFGSRARRLAACATATALLACSCGSVPPVERVAPAAQQKCDDRQNNTRDLSAPIQPLVPDPEAARRAPLDEVGVSLTPRVDSPLIEKEQP